MEQLGAAIQGLMPERRNLVSDLIAGLTFAVVNVPQAMAHALLATVNPVLGIYTLIVAAPVAAVFTSSVYMNVSTTAALSVAANAGLEGVPDSQRVETLAVLVLLMGAFQLAAGLFRLGFLVRFVSNAVMTGFLNGVAVLIILGQLGHLTGFQSAYSNQVARALDLLLHLGEISVQATIIGVLALGGIALLLATELRKFAFIIAIAATTALLALLTLPGAGAALGFGAVVTVSELGKIPREWPELTIPSPALILSTLLPALSVAIIGLIQGAGVSQGTPNPDGKYPNVSRDFLGQGAANIAAAFIGGMPAGGSISGTVLVMSAGAKSRWTNIFAGLFVAVVVAAATPLVEMVPMPGLAALLIVAGFQGLRVESAIAVWNAGKVNAAVMVSTFGATLLLPLQDAVLTGAALSILVHIFREAKQVIVTQIVLVRGGLPEERPAPPDLPSNELTILQVYGSLFFAGSKYLEDNLPKLDRTTRAVVALGLRGQTEAGSTFMSVLQRYAQALQSRDSKLMLVGVDPALGYQLAKTGVLKLIGEENVFAATPKLGGAMNNAAAEAYVWLGQSPEGTLLVPSSQ
jgi:sulfate permease, SulP family